MPVEVRSPRGRRDTGLVQIAWLRRQAFCSMLRPYVAPNDTSRCDQPLFSVPWEIADGYEATG